MKTNVTGASRNGFTLVEIMIVVAIMGLLVSLALPNFIKTRTQAQKNICLENLAQLESAKQIWGVENGKAEGDEATDDEMFGPYSYMKQRPYCPGGGVYDLTRIGENATCTEAGHVLPQ